MTREERFALDLANEVAPMRTLLADYAAAVIDDYADKPVIISASDGASAAEAS